MSRIALYSALIEAGASKEKAEEAVKELVTSKDAATKSDINELKVEMAQMKTSIAEAKVTIMIATTIYAGVIIGVVTFVR